MTFGSGGSLARQLKPTLKPADYGRFETPTVPVLSPDEQKRLEAEKKPVRLSAGTRALRTGEERRYAEVRAFQFSGDGRFIALHGYAPETPRGKGADLRVVDLASGTETVLGNVTSYAWSDRGALLALLIATGTDAPNGAHIFRRGDGAAARA